MNNNLSFTLDGETLDKLESFSELLQKEPSLILKEALLLYFSNEERKLAEKSQSDQDAMTNLDFDEFWDDVDI